MSDVMDRDQVEIFARGLYHLASVDGIDERELTVIREFLSEAGQSSLFEQLSQRPFDLHEAHDVLETSFLRRLFIRAAIVLVRADGELSAAERTAVEGLADAFGQSDLLGELEAEVDGVVAFA